MCFLKVQTSVSSSKLVKIFQKWHSSSENEKNTAKSRYFKCQTFAAFLYFSYFSSTFSIIFEWKLVYFKGHNTCFHQTFDYKKKINFIVTLRI